MLLSSLVQPEAPAPIAPSAVIAAAIPNRTIVTFRIAFSLLAKA